MNKLMEMMKRAACLDIPEEAKDHVIAILKIEWKAQKRAFITRRGW